VEYYLSVWILVERTAFKLQILFKQLYQTTKERRVRCLRNVIRTDDCRISKQALNWNSISMNRKPGRPGKNWQDIIRRDLKDIGLTWDEASELAQPRSSWRQRVAQCVFDTG